MIEHESHQIELLQLSIGERVDLALDDDRPLLERR